MLASCRSSSSMLSAADLLVIYLLGKIKSRFHKNALNVAWGCCECSKNVAVRWQLFWGGCVVCSHMNVTFESAALCNPASVVQKIALKNCNLYRGAKVILAFGLLSSLLIQEMKYQFFCVCSSAFKTFGHTNFINQISLPRWSNLGGSFIYFDLKNFPFPFLLLTNWEKGLTTQDFFGENRTKTTLSQKYTNPKKFKIKEKELRRSAAYLASLNSAPSNWQKKDTKMHLKMLKIGKKTYSKCKDIFLIAATVEMCRKPKNGRSRFRVALLSFLTPKLEIFPKTQRDLILKELKALQILEIELYEFGG